MQLFIWFLFYGVIWSLYNSYFKWQIYKAGRKQYLFSMIFFLIGAVIFNFYFYTYTKSSISTLLLALIVSIGIGFFFSTFFPFYKRIKNGRYFLAALPVDILFQQSMVIVAIKILNQYVGTGYIDLYFGIFFAITHLPVLFFKWSKLRYLIVLISLGGGTLFSYFIRDYGDTGALFAFLMHFCIYVPIFYYLQDEKKI